MLRENEPGTPPPRALDHAVATFLRTVQTHHVALSQMADQKANVLIAASFVVISTIFHETSQNGFSPVLGMLTCFSASFLAAMAILPRAKKIQNRRPESPVLRDLRHPFTRGIPSHDR
jgi:hypothetical protein